MHIKHEANTNNLRIRFMRSFAGPKRKGVRAGEVAYRESFVSKKAHFQYWAVEMYHSGEWSAPGQPHHHHNHSVNIDKYSFSPEPIKGTAFQNNLPITIDKKWPITIFTQGFRK